MPMALMSHFGAISLCVNIFCTFNAVVSAN